VGCAGARRDIGPRAKAGIEQVHVSQACKRRFISAEAIGLENDLVIPVYPQPVEILDYAGDMFRTAARPVYILDPKPKRAAIRAGEVHC
jgi:hypothetical protein